MNSAAADRFLDRAEQALLSSHGGRRESETAFLQRLLHELASDVSRPGLSPAELLRALSSNRPLMHDARNVLDVVAMPSRPPETALRRGDWMLRVVPGTGDVGHVAVLTSDDLLAQPMLAPEGIAAESAHPGHYGLVIEAGAFPHSRSRPFARRWLDERGRVPPHTVVLRPKYSDPEAPGPAEEAEDFNRADIRWVQRSLNRIMGLRLTEDGIAGAQTRSAIRRFQQIQGLGVDGVVGPETEAAIKVALDSLLAAASVCPPAQTIQRAVYGWSRYKHMVQELPPDQQAILAEIGDLIRSSFEPGCTPIGIVEVQGHADHDTPRNPQREQQYSEDRAQAAADWLKSYVGASIAGRINWDTKGLGATQLKARPTTEANRRQNRRVEVLAYYNAASQLPSIPPPPDIVPVPPIPPPPEIIPAGAVFAKPDIPVVIVPGIMGTRLFDPVTKKMAWDPPATLADWEAWQTLQRMDPSDSTRPAPLDPAPSPLFAAYSQLFFELANHYKVYAAGYDWRQDNKLSARQLASAIETIGAKKVVLVAHSMGGLVSRYYCRTGGESKVCGLILIGSPTLGAPKAYRMLKVGQYWDPSFPFGTDLARSLSVAMGGISGQVAVGTVRRTIRNIVRKFPSAYQLLPNRAYCKAFPDWLNFNSRLTQLPPVAPKPTDASDPHELYWNGHTGFLEKRSRAIEASLKGRNAFDKDLEFGTYMHPNTYVLYGQDMGTETGAVLTVLGGGRAGPLILNKGNNGPPSDGDGTVPAISASATGTGAHLVGLPGVNHGDLVTNKTAISQIEMFVADAIKRCPLDSTASTPGTVLTLRS